MQLPSQSRRDRFFGKNLYAGIAEVKAASVTRILALCINACFASARVDRQIQRTALDFPQMNMRPGVVLVTLHQDDFPSHVVDHERSRT